MLPLIFRYSFSPKGSKHLDDLSPDKLSKLSPSQLDEALPDGWKYNSSPDGRYVHIRDGNGNYRIRIDPPDKVTNYRHIHVFDGKGNALDINGKVVPYKSPDAHIPYNK